MKFQTVLNFKSSLKFINEQVLFSLSSFIFLRNYLKELDFNTAAIVGIYLVATFSLLSIIRPLGIQAYSEVINQEYRLTVLPFSLILMIKLRIPLLAAGLILTFIGFAIDTPNQLRILLPVLGLLFILSDLFRFQNILNGKPNKNFAGNMSVLLLSMFSFLSNALKSDSYVLYLWIFSQIIYCILVRISGRNLKRTLESQISDFNEVGRVLSIEIFVSQLLGFIFIFLLTKVNAELSGQFRVATSAFTAIPIVFFSALASPYSIKVASGSVKVRQQLLRLSSMFLIFLFSYFVFANFRVFGPLMAGRETKSFESGIAPAFIVATLITLISHITYSFAKTLSNFAYVLVRVLPVAILYALILILTSSFPNLTSEEFLWAYLFFAYLYVAFFIHIYGVEQNAVK